MFPLEIFNRTRSTHSISWIFNEIFFANIYFYKHLKAESLNFQFLNLFNYKGYGTGKAPH